jgi:hypothetical protein
MMTTKKQGGMLKSTGNDVRWRALLESVRTLIQQGRQQALRAVDTIQVRTCWEIGRHIVEFEQGGAEHAEYGKGLVRHLAQALTREFGKGFDASSLWRMCGFF